MYTQSHASCNSNFSIVLNLYLAAGLIVSQPIGPIHLLFLPARRSASAGNSDRNVSVRLSVRPSVTCRYCVKTTKASVMISSPSGCPKTLVF